MCACTSHASPQPALDTNMYGQHTHTHTGDHTRTHTHTHSSPFSPNEKVAIIKSQSLTLQMPRLHVHTSCDRILTNEVTLILMWTHVAPSAATIAPRSIPRRCVYTSAHEGLRCLQPMRVQCLGFTRHLSATYCVHLVLISNFPFPRCAFQFPASIWFHM